MTVTTFRAPARGNSARGRLVEKSPLRSDWHLQALDRSSSRCGPWHTAVPDRSSYSMRHTLFLRIMQWTAAARSREAAHPSRAWWACQHLSTDA